MKQGHILFISGSEKDRPDAILAGFQSERILTVSEAGGFLQGGGVINFILQGEGVRFEVRPENAQRAEMQINSKLLSSGKIIGPCSKGGV